MKDFCIANRITIGWFGVPGSNRPGSQTHLVVESEDNKVLCGTKFSPLAEYQWCIPSWRDGDPECERCKKIKAQMFHDITKPIVKKNANSKNVHFSSATNEWSTPLPLFKWLDGMFRFTLDPCCTKATALCRVFYTKANDGLKRSWANERVYMNPPYGREIGTWVKKAYEESLKGATVVCLIPARTDTKWWRDYCLHASRIIFLTGRIKFLENGSELKAGAPFPSCVVVFHPPTKRVPFECFWRDLKEVTRSTHDA